MVEMVRFIESFAASETPLATTAVSSGAIRPSTVARAANSRRSADFLVDTKSSATLSPPGDDGKMQQHTCGAGDHSRRRPPKSKTRGGRGGLGERAGKKRCLTGAGDAIADTAAMTTMATKRALSLKPLSSRFLSLKLRRVLRHVVFRGSLLRSHRTNSGGAGSGVGVGLDRSLGPEWDRFVGPIIWDLVRAESDSAENGGKCDSPENDGDLKQML